MRLTLGLIGVLSLFGFFASDAHAAFNPITYRYQHHLFTLDPDHYPQWQAPREAWMFEGKEVLPPASLRIDGDVLPAPPPGMERTTKTDWNEGAIAATIDRLISAKFHRDPGRVTIYRTASGSVEFDGLGLTGRDINMTATVKLTIEALRAGITEIQLPVIETQPVMNVSPDLASRGIREVVTIGESDFSGSPANRQHNIHTGLSKFNGHVIPQGTTFSFNAILGPVDGTTGYRKELVIKGDRTEPDYGGGLCQVSTTAYRGVWEYGFPIAQRINHSYTVQYYGPFGTDATVYPPNPDVKFVNDGPSDLLIQTHAENGKAYFIYYGTRDRRKSEVLGPFVWGTSAPPPDRTIYTTELEPGERKKLGERHAGMSVAWYRFIKTQTGALRTETFASIYEARPLFYEVGVETLPEEENPEGAEGEGDAKTPDDEVSELPPLTFGSTETNRDVPRP